MKTYDVSVCVHAVWFAAIEAASEDEALEIARTMVRRSDWTDSSDEPQWETLTADAAAAA